METLSPQLRALIDGHPHVLCDRLAAEKIDGFGKSLYLADFWTNLRAQHRAQRTTIDPLALGAPVLPHIVLLDVIGEGDDFRWRLFGGAHTDEYGINLTGMHLNELKKHNPATGEVELIFRHATETREPTWYRIDYVNDRGCRRACCGVILPLFDANGTMVTHLLGCSEWVNR
ncbi:PAS domain-containing protein [Nisaea sediminum]|uniref:hypothetical protein n=1 Tax=Nisaea sediminum TaxID=2775867 RepID=UPI0018664F3B|nr:hypothetical protein [Nisaea sediminum]